MAKQLEKSKREGSCFGWSWDPSRACEKHEGEALKKPSKAILAITDSIICVVIIMNHLDMVYLEDPMDENSAETRCGCDFRPHDPKVHG